MREILVKFIFDWPEYDDIADEYLIIDLELEKFLKDGVKFKIMKEKNINEN